MPACDRNTIEILAPAGDLKSLICAVNNGADAVYCGVGNYNARAKATNFSFEDFAEAIGYAHFFGVKIYVVFNILYKHEEYGEVLTCIERCHNMGADAFILQDLALIYKIKSTMPDIVIHLSTQAGVHNVQGAIVAERLGVKRVVLSRETLLSDIREIKNKTNLEIEFFVQGALCISFSGNCYFSSLVSGYSGNRGKCLQLCRKKYSFKNRSGYWLSAKDINMSNNIAELIDAGITSFKIEGRMRRPEYVSESVKCYKNLTSGLSYNQKNLRRMFNRGNYTNIYISNQSNDVIYNHAQNHIGDKIGYVKAVKNNIAYFDFNVNKGDGLKFFHHNIETGHALVSCNDNKTTYVGTIKSRDEVRITTDAKLNEKAIKRKRYVAVDLLVSVNAENAFFRLKTDAISVEFSLQDLQQAKNYALTRDDILECFNKTDDYCFRISETDITINADVFVAKSVLNNVRRQLYDNLKNEILNNYQIEKDCGCFVDVFSNLNKFECFEKCTIIQTDNVEIANDCSDYYDYVAFFPKKWDSDLVENLMRLKKPFLLVLPNVIRGEDLKTVQKIIDLPIVENVIVNNLCGLEIAKKKRILMGVFMNFINDEINCSKICSVETKNTNPNNFVYLYGNYPLMTYCHCPLRSFYGKCVQCGNEIIDKLYDEKGNEFSFYSYKLKHCYCYLLNNKTINLTGTMINTQRIFIDLIGAEKGMCRDILKKIYNKQKINGGTLAYYNKILE